MPLSLLGSVLRRQNASPAPATLPSPNDASGDVPDAAASPTGPVKAATGNSTTSPAPSRPASSSSLASAEEKPKKRAPRPKTTYKLAQPPPGSQKLHIRPKVLLQLHQVVAERRPKPVYEVIPYSILAPVSTRRLARTFRSKDKLGAHDLLIVKAEEYGTNDEAKSDDERWGARDVVAIICPGKEEKGNTVKTEVLMDNGSSWEVTNTPNGGYEFTYTDDHGLALKSRWVPRLSNPRRQSGSTANHGLPSPSPEDRKFTFSTISANSRRHPIIATMTRDRIDVQDSYTMPTATSPPTPSLPPSAGQTPAGTPILDVDSFIDAKENLPVTTDDALRRFIVASGIWVAFRESWSSAYSSSKNAFAPSICTSTTLRPAHPNRSISMTVVESPRSASPASTIDENKRRIPRLIRTGTQLLHRNASFTNSPSEASPVSSPVLKTRSRRSNSTGNADLRSAVGSTKRYGLGLETEVLPETEEERQVKRSTELQRIKDLSLPSPTEKHKHSLTIEFPTPDRNSSLTSSDTRDRSDSGDRRARSVFNPVTTTGLWDSGVDHKKGLKTRPTSLVVVQEKKKKAKQKEERSKSRDKNKEKKEKKEKDKEKEKDSRRKSEGLKHFFTGMFRKEKAAV